MSSSELSPVEQISVAAIEGVGPRLAHILGEMGITSVGDLLRHYPHRYIDLATVKKIAEVVEGDELTVVGRVTEISARRGRQRRVQILTAVVDDGTGWINAVWFNQNYIADRLRAGMTVALSGKVSRRYGGPQIQTPFYDILEEERGDRPVNTGRIIPVHPAGAKLSAARLRGLIAKALTRFGDSVIEPLPGELRARYGLPLLPETLRLIHFPAGRQELLSARKRLIFEEFFFLQLGLALRKRRLTDQTPGIGHRVTGRLLKPFYDGLPWRLTVDQQLALKEIRRDMEAAIPMQRLLLGEVGSGKTVVAAAAILMAAESGRQAALMAPTEVLAEQHYIKLRRPLEELGLGVCLLMGGQTATQRNPALARIAVGEVDVVIGTHALVQEKVDFADLGLVVIDEQHRFGVRQRLGLRAKGNMPDMLVLTATPIPRTLALTLYGDLDVSTLRERPGGRSVADHIKTKYVIESRRQSAYSLIRREVKAGRRAYIVCPLVDESDKVDAKSVMGEAENLQSNVFPDLRVGLLHGRMSSVEKERAMSAFRDGELDVLISTTVIEVGVDVPEATVILIEHAERFGLSQLHQLRGRVGRGEWPSYCLLTGDLKTDDSRARVNALLEIEDGFKLAEADLAIRGEGEILGARQSGLPDLKLAKLTKHADALDKARREAFAIIEDDPGLERTEHRALRAELRRRFSGGVDWLMSG
jgi:ATP-dependent DNA helicase RecG